MKDVSTDGAQMLLRDLQQSDAEGVDNYQGAGEGKKRKQTRASGGKRKSK